MRSQLAAAFLLAGTIAAQDQPTAKTVPPAGGQPAVAVPTKPMPPDPRQYAGAAKAWFPELEQRITVHAGEAEAKAVYRFKNPRSQVVEWKQLAGSCTCSRALVLIGDRKYELRPKPAHLALVSGQPGAEQRQDVESIPIDPGQEGEVQVCVDAHTMKGPKVVSLDIHTTDSEVPMVRLQLTAMSDQDVTVTPAEINLGVVPGGEARAFTAMLTSARKDFEVTPSGPFPMGIEVTVERQPTTEMSSWLIKGTYRKDLPGDTRAELEFRTNLASTPVVKVKLFATVRNLVEMDPGIFVLGIVRKGKGSSARVTFTATDGKNLDAVALRLEKLSLPEQYVALRSVKDGAKLVVELQVAADAPPGLIRGDVVVELNHPGVKEQRVLFNGFVR